MKQYRIEYRDFVEQTFEAIIDTESEEEARELFSGMDMTENNMINENERIGVIDEVSEIEEE